ncbi:F0F1 ATP synthase subunit A [Williamwhitmania taraxaci]|uniref:ATP synthase subunit a n=1 Tax=Williamwhitmania taraxaci TaxID=1640674 RepID=A0A1G6H0W6_9BACT|nr:F0F1 ATP synthase subunit A [Williamwhitmania taraxaci]SDB87036.1 F-type H+-transporting ATPase subunit a [Williamwhitmania taraxaci]
MQHLRHTIGILVFMGFFHFGFAQDSVQDTSVHSGKKFLPGEFIMEHIGDAYSWHITSIGETELSIPLPVILYSKHTGFHVFMSSKLHKSSYHNFSIPSDGKYKGKIVESVAQLDGSVLTIRPIDISITKVVLSVFMTVGFMIWIFLSVARTYVRNPDKAPSGVQNLFEPMILFVRDDIALPSIGENRYRQYMPFLLTIFFFIWFVNMLGLIPIFPGGANVTGNIAITIVLALFTFVITMFSTNKHYWVEVFNNPEIPWWLKLPIPIVPIVEFSGVFTKPFVLMIRLFANILAGHMVATVFFSLIFIFGNLSVTAGYGFSILTILFTVFMSLLEVLVAFIQAYVFTMLSAIYFGMAKVEAHHTQQAH